MRFRPRALWVGCRVGCVGVPEVGRVVRVAEEHAFVPGRVGVGVQGVVAGGVIAAAAGRFAGSILFGGAPGAAIDVEPDVGAVGVNLLLRDVELVERVGAGGVAELPDERGDFVVAGLFVHDQGEGVVGVVEELEGRGGRGRARRVGGGGFGLGGGYGGGRGRRLAAEEE